MIKNKILHIILCTSLLLVLGCKSNAPVIAPYIAIENDLNEFALKGPVKTLRALSHFDKTKYTPEKASFYGARIYVDTKFGIGKNDYDSLGIQIEYQSIGDSITQTLSPLSKVDKNHIYIYIYI